MADLRVCGKCGKYNVATAEVCAACGEQLGGQAAIVLRDSGSRLVGIVVGLIVLIASATFGYALFIGSETASAVAFFGIPIAWFLATKFLGDSVGLGRILRWMFPYKTWH